MRWDVQREENPLCCLAERFRVSTQIMKEIIAVMILAATLSAFAQTDIPAKERMVVVISLDGFPGFALEDPSQPVPTLRKLIREGARARMHIINPTITWPNHTTMVTGVHADEHGLLLNGTIVRTNGWPPIKVDPKIDKTQMVHAPTVYDAAYEAGLTTAQIDWVAIHNAPTITWPFSEWVSPDDAVAYEMIQRGVLAINDVQDF